MQRNRAVSSPSPSSIPSSSMELAILLPLLLLIQFVVIPQGASADTLPRQADDQLESSLQTRPRYVLLHPPTGDCVIRDLKYVDDPLLLGPCSRSDSWYYSPQQLLMMKGTYYCLQVIGAGEKLKPTIRCSPRYDTWEFVTGPSGKTQIMQRRSGVSPSALCLEADAGGLLSQPCRCLPDAGAKGVTDEPCDVSSQWFEYHNENGVVVFN